MINFDTQKDSAVSFFHPVTKFLVRAFLKTPAMGGWWVQTEDGFGWFVNTADLNWKTWMGRPGGPLSRL